MIRDYDNRARDWNTFLICRTDFQLDVHLSKEILQTKTMWGALYSPVEISDLADRCQLPG
jgi:hypothetical protein